jgi:hypothetical protein
MSTSDKLLPNSRAELVRTSVVLPHVLDQNLVLWCTRRHVAKGQAIRMAIHKFLEAEGMQPEREPKIEFSY